MYAAFGQKLKKSTLVKFLMTIFGQQHILGAITFLRSIRKLWMNLDQML
jgi:hypothetical protein